MNSDQVESIVRTVAKIGGAYLVSTGHLAGSNLEMFIGGVVILVGVIWSFVKHADAPKA